MKKIVLIVIILSAFYSAKAQWKAKAELGSSFYSGNVNKFDLRSKGNISHVDSLFELSAFYKTIYAENNHVQNNEEYSGGFKFDYLPQSRFSPFVVLSAYRNDFKNIRQRLSSILGAKYVYFQSEKSNYSLSVAGQYDMEHYVAESPDKNKIRLSIRPKIKLKIGQTAYFQNITFFQPNVQNWADYIINSSTSLTTKITKAINLKLSYEIEYVNEPTKEGLLKTDQAFLASLVFKI